MAGEEEKEGIVIEINLDSGEYKKSLRDVTKSTDKNSKEITSSLESMSVSINKSITGSVKSIESSIKSLIVTLDLISRTFVFFVPAIILLEQRFGFLSKVLASVGLDLGRIFDRVIKLKSAFSGFISGERSVQSLKIAFGQLLQEIGLVDKASLKLLNTMDNLALSSKTEGRAIHDFRESLNRLVLTAAQLIPVLVFIEQKTGIFSKSLEKIGVDFEEVTEKFGKFIKDLVKFALGEKSAFGLKIALGSLLQEMGLIDSKMISIVQTLGQFSFNTDQAVKGISALAATGTGLATVAVNFDKIKGLTSDLSRILFKGKGFFGLVSSLSSVAIGLSIVAEGLHSTNNAFAKSIAFTAQFTAILLGGLAAGIIFTTVKIGELAAAVGTKLVGFFNSAANSFNDAERSLEVFAATVSSLNRSSKESIGTFGVWEAVVGQVANKFNLVTGSVRKSAQEIVLVGEKIGLVESEMRKLLVVSSEYAKINKKDVFQTTVNFINALNGNAQAVVALGVKLSQTSLQQFAYANGITKSIQAMSDQEKVQLRFNKVLKQYSEVAGIGVVAANSLADASIRLETNQKRLTTALGEGARIIEQNNLIAFAYDKVLNNLSTTTTKALGFFGALGARMLQVGGIFLKFSFTLFGVIKGFELLKVLLASELGIKAFSSSIPLLGLSLNQLLTNLSGTKVEIKSLGSLMKALGGTFTQQFDTFSKIIFGHGTKNLTVLKALKGGFAQLRLAVLKTASTLGPFIAPMAIVALKIGLVVGAVTLIVKAFQSFDEKTGALTDIWNILTSAISEGESIFSPLIELFSKITDKAKDLASKGFGLIVFGIASVIGAMTALASKDPFGAFSEDTIKKLNAVNTKIQIFKDNLFDVGFKIGDITRNISRSIASAGNSMRFTFEEMAKIVNELRERYENFGISHSKVLEMKAERELAALSQFISVNNLEGQALAEHLELKASLHEDFSRRIREAREKETLDSKSSFENVTKAFVIQAKNMKTTAGQLAKTMLNLGVKGFGNAFRAVGAAIASGGNALQAFADSIKSTFGELAGALGDFYIKRGIAAFANNEPGAGAIIAAGAGLKILSGILGASSTSSGTAGAGGGSSTGSAGAPDVESGQITQTSAERPEADTNLIVNFNGDVIDSEDTGQRLVDVMGDAFEKKGIALRGFRQA